MRKDKHNYYLDIADGVLERSTCIRRNYGAVIVRNDEIVSTGYNGAPRGRKNCCDLNVCARAEMNIPSGERYELCRSVHAEMNAIISAKREEMIDSTLYLSGVEFKTGQYIKNAEPCSMCKRMILNAGISKVIIRIDKEFYTEYDVDKWKDNDDTLKPLVDIGVFKIS